MTASVPTCGGRGRAECSCVITHRGGQRAQEWREKGEEREGREKQKGRRDKEEREETREGGSRTESAAESWVLAMFWKTSFPSSFMSIVVLDTGGKAEVSHLPYEGLQKHLS